MDNVKRMIFTEESVRAILAGTKTQTRRVIKPQPPLNTTHTKMIEISKINGIYTPEYKHSILHFLDNCGENREVCTAISKLDYKQGDIIYVRETWTWNDNLKCYGHKASCPAEFLDPSKWIRNPWKSPKRMPKAAARIFLRITDVRVERLHQISEADAIAEGMTRTGKEMLEGVLYEEKYVEHWDKINGNRDKGVYKWENNPWVFVYTFERIERGEVNGF